MADFIGIFAVHTLKRHAGKAVSNDALARCGQRGFQLCGGLGRCFAFLGRFAGDKANERKGDSRRENDVFFHDGPPCGLPHIRKLCRSDQG